VPRTLSFLHKPLTDEHRRAQRVKREAKVLVCLGNPPYDRQEIDPADDLTERKGGWVRFGEALSDRPPLLDDFLRPARAAGQGVHLKNLYNDYVYFWRWALWKVFEADNGPGIVTFITASSYLRGPGFVGMRQLMRELADEIWIIDLEGDGLGTRKTENVFAIRRPVAIAVAVRYDQPNPGRPAAVHHARIQGTRSEKLACLESIRSFSDLPWRECFTEWQAPFLPQGEGKYFAWPLMSDLFPWQHSGVQFKRTWPIAETVAVLQSRWDLFLSSTVERKSKLFRETTARRVAMGYESLVERGARLTPLADLKSGSPLPGLMRYGFRAFDRQWALIDPRFADRIRPELVRAHSDRQIYLTSLLSEVIGEGPAAVVTPYLPDLHHFRGSFGGRDVVPLWRDRQASQPNITDGLLALLGREYGRSISPEDFFCYCYSLLASPAYVKRFWDELSISSPRLPVTRDRRLFERGASLGRRLVWLHTFGERCRPEGGGRGSRWLTGRARAVRPLSTQANAYPETFRYDESAGVLYVGEGSLAPVDRAVWEFSVSGLEVVKSWLAYRMRSGAGRTSSDLDRVRPQRWTAELTEELLRVIWMLEATVDSFPDLSESLEAILAGASFSASDLPVPVPGERGSLEEEDPSAALQLAL
jgi:hypothetical protein